MSRNAASGKAQVLDQSCFDSSLLQSQQERDFVDCIWGSLLDSISIDGCEVVPLTSAEDLRREGKKMHHCVAKYWKNCCQGSSRMFSIISSDGRSTLELRKEDDDWDIAQHKGVCNGMPPNQHKRVAVKVLYAYQDADIFI